jgi:hypothetical protein
MAIQTSEPDTLEKVSYILFPNFLSFFIETFFGLVLLGVTLFKEWDIVSGLSSESSVFENIGNIYNKISDAVSSTTYGRAITTIIFWALIGVACYGVVVKIIAYINAAKQVMDEKNNDVFPHWYTGGSFFHDSVVSLGKWLLRHAAAIILLIFSVFFCLPLASAYAHIGIYGTFDPVMLIIAFLALVFATRLFGISLCIFSKKITAWYAR